MIKIKTLFQGVAFICVFTGAITGLSLTGFTLLNVAPKAFTPEEGAGSVNCVRFTFSNPYFAEVTIRIFDICGAKIRSSLRRESANVMAWDGRNDGGGFVRGGIYIYQAEAGEKIFSGTIVVVK